jgi:hypothetical protein
MKKLTIRQESGSVQTITLKGDAKRYGAEPDTLRVRFPGGEFEIVRTSDDDYWIHVYANSPEREGWDDAAILGQVTEGRIDTHDCVLNLGKGGLDLLDECVYHVAFRVARREGK